MSKLNGLLSLSTANLVYAICQWVPVAILARLGSTDDVAAYTLAISVPAPFLMLAQLNLRNVLASDVREVTRFAVYRNLRIGAVLAAVVAVGLVSRSLLITLGAAALAAEWIGDIYQGEMQRQDRTLRAAVSVALRGLTLVAALSLALWMGLGVVGALSAILAVRVLLWLGFESHGMVTAAGEPVRSAEWRELIATAWPLGLVMMAGSVASNLPRYLAEFYIGHTALAAFAVVWALAALGNLITNSIGQASMSALARVAASGDSAGFARISWMLVSAGLALGAVGVICGQLLGGWTLRLLYGASYEQYQPLLVAVLGAAGFGYAASLLGTVITAARRFREQIPVQIASLAAGLIAGALAMPVMGVMGTAVALAVSNAVQLGGEVVVLRMALRGMAAEGTVAQIA
jgi:O-antigen/teichoic acid export membrane protein